MTRSWFVERRLDYIDYLLLTRGTVQRSCLMSTFGMCMVQASKDIGLFRRLYPDAMRYDASCKEYVAREGYRTKRGLTSPVLVALEHLADQRHPMGWHS